MAGPVLSPSKGTVSEIVSALKRRLLPARFGVERSKMFRQCSEGRRVVWSCQTLVCRKQGVQEKLKLRLEMSSGLQMSGKSAGGL